MREGALLGRRGPACSQPAWRRPAEGRKLRAISAQDCVSGPEKPLELRRCGARRAGGRAWQPGAAAKRPSGDYSPPWPARLAGGSYLLRLLRSEGRGRAGEQASELAASLPQLPLPLPLPLRLPPRSPGPGQPASQPAAHVHDRRRWPTCPSQPRSRRRPQLSACQWEPPPPGPFLAGDSSGGAKRRRAQRAARSAAGQPASQPGQGRARLGSVEAKPGKEPCAAVGHPGSGWSGAERASYPTLRAVGLLGTPPGCPLVAPLLRVMYGHPEQQFGAEEVSGAAE